MANAGEIGQGALGGATTGATIGALGGPVGAAIGGGAGAILGGGLAYLRGRKADQERRRAEAERQRAMQYYQPAATNAADLYGQNMARSSAAYQSGPVREFDAGQQIGRQNDNLAVLGNAAAGNGPSAAAAQYSAAQQQSQAARLGMAAGAHGADRGAARLQAIAGFGSEAGQAAAQSAALRAQEQQAAMAQYAQAVQAARTGDLQAAQGGVQRDVSADTAARDAFMATHNAQQGYLQGAGQAVGQQNTVAANQAGTATGAYEQGVKADAASRAQGAAQNQAILNTATDFYTKYKQGQGKGGNVVTH